MERFEHLRLDELFRSSGGQPVEVGGQLVHLAYTLPIGRRIVAGRIVIESFAQDPVQGICLQMKKGEVEANNIRNAGMVFWTDTAPREVRFKVFGKSGSTLQIWNCWRGRFGEREAWIGSAGLVWEPLGGQRFRFLCSDGPGAPVFDALVFDVMLDGLDDASSTGKAS